MSSTFSYDSAVRLADTVQPGMQSAALNDLSLAALDAGMANSCRANARSWETAFVSSIWRAYLDSQALDFAGGRSSVITKQLIVLLGRNKLGKPQNINT